MDRKAMLSPSSRSSEKSPPIASQTLCIFLWSFGDIKAQNNRIFMLLSPKKHHLEIHEQQNVNSTAAHRKLFLSRSSRVLSLFVVA